jgi:hypothetical protein
MATTKFICQPKSHLTCVPTAVVNALRWLGSPMGHQLSVPDLSRRFGKVRGSGLAFDDYARHLERILRQAGSSVRFRLRPSVGDIAKAIDDGCAVIIRWSRPHRSDGHVSFVYGRRSDGRFLIANQRPGISRTSRHRPERLRKLLRRGSQNKTESRCWCWIVRPKQ